MSAMLVPEICRKCPQLVCFKDPHGCAEFSCKANEDPELCQEREDQYRAEWEREDAARQDRQRYEAEYERLYGDR